MDVVLRAATVLRDRFVAAGTGTTGRETSGAGSLVIRGEGLGGTVVDCVVGEADGSMVCWFAIGCTSFLERILEKTIRPATPPLSTTSKMTRFRDMILLRLIDALL